jgi:serine/threonine protein kinase
MSSLFLSYRRGDSSGTVKHLYERLKSRLPRWIVFYDHKILLPGEDLPERLRHEVTTAEVVLCVIGPRWVDLLRERQHWTEIDHVREEVRLALLAKHKVIPLLVEGASMPREADLAEFPELKSLCRLIGQAVRPDPDFDSDVERLAAYLDQLGPGVGAGSVLGGKYKILREVSQGGMGVVYEAEQQTPRRIVAVKMILEGMDTKEVLARFDSEKEAVARMDHPNISRVIDSGSGPSGKPYFVMEFVRGEPITTYCDRKRLLPTDRLGLLRHVCSAVQHAHQKGIVHRDIKPSNVLVEEIDGHPLPKVIDFGLAKALAGKLTEKTLFSEIGKTVGTLIYASPEQAAGRQYDIDTRTDVYSLGVLMYELLVGAPPFTQEELNQVGDEAMRRQIIETEPAKPSTNLSSSNALPIIAANRQLEPHKLARMVRGELDWIALRALEKDPKRRYESASQLSDDIDRYLNNEPVKAGKPSTVYRLKKFVRRNRISVLAGCLVFGTLVAGVVGTSLGLSEAQRQEGIARNESTEKSRALQEKSRALQTADQALAAVTEEKMKTSIALARVTEQAKETTVALAAETEQRIRAVEALTTTRLALIEAADRLAETRYLRARKSAIEKQANEFKLQQLESSDKSRELEWMLETSTRQNADLRDRVIKLSTRLRRNGLSADVSQTKGLESPPPVTGEVKRIDSTNHQMEITIGADDGLAPDMELFIFRKNPPEVLGKVIILAVEPDQAVAKVIGSTNQEKKIKQGDIVSSTKPPN